MNSEFYTKTYVRRALVPDIFKEIKPHFIDYHTMTVHKDYVYPSHKHSEYELILVVQGPYYCSLNSENISVENDKVIIIKPGDNHQDYLKAGQHHVVLHFSMREGLFRSNVKPDMQITAAPVKEVHVILKKIHEEYEMNDRSSLFSGALQDSLMETLFWFCVRQLSADSLSETFYLYSQKRQFASELYSLFSRNLANPILMDSIADAMSMSKRNLSLKCRRYLSSSPAQLFLKYRIDKAKTELEKIEKPIKEISAELGFDNQFDFSRSFKRITGKSPSEYRMETSFIYDSFL